MKIRFIQGMLTYTFFSFFVLSIFGIHGDIFMSIYSFLMGIEVGLVIYDYLVYKNVFKRIGKSINRFFVKLKDKKNLRLMMCCIFVLTLFTSVKSVSAETTSDYSDRILSCSNTVNLFDNKYTDKISFTATVGKNYFDTSVYNYGFLSTSIVAVTPGIDYTFSAADSISYCTGNFYAFFLDSSYNFISEINKLNRTYTFTIPDGVSYVAFGYKNAYASPQCLNQLTNNSIQFEKGSTATDYVAYEECSTPDPNPDTPDDSTTTVEIDYTIFCTIAVIIGIIFIYNFLKPMFYRKG